MGERKEKHDGQNQKNRGGERENRERGKKKEHSNQRSGVERSSEGNSEETVKEFIREKLKIETEIERAQKIRRGGKVKIIVATMKSKEEKIRVMKEKRKLEKGIYIDDDMTRKEREIQQQIRILKWSPLLGKLHIWSF